MADNNPPITLELIWEHDLVIVTRWLSGTGALNQVVEKAIAEIGPSPTGQ